MTIPPRPSVPARSTALADVPAPRQAPVERAADARGPVEGTVLAGLAWIVREITHVPGVLRLRHGRLSFESTRGVLFDATASDLGLELGRSPRAGMHVTVGSERLRVCVVRPPGCVDPCRDLVERAVDPGVVTAGRRGRTGAGRSAAAARLGRRRGRRGRRRSGRRGRRECRRR